MTFHLAISQARAFERSFNHLPRNHQGFLLDSPRLKDWSARMWAAAVYVDEECPQSYDSTVVIRFADGSLARFSNPRGLAFPEDFHEEVR